MAHKKGVLAQVESKSGAFAVVFLILFGITFGFLVIVGATPDAPGTTKNSDLALNDSDTGSTGNTPSPSPSTTAKPSVAQTPVQSNTSSGQGANPTPTKTNTPTYATTGILPTRVVVKKAGINVTVSNPTTTDVDILDTALAKGAIRYPTSGTLGVNGTVLLFGHSSYLPIVHNQAYKSFDGIQDLKNGDIISVFSGDTEYQFSVTGVRVADATTDTVALPTDAEHLTLVTCDSFATKSNRYVVTADFVKINQ